MGLGTWAWGNQLLWGYDKSMDPELQQLFNLVVSKGINIFDTADSYGMSQSGSDFEALDNIALTDSTKRYKTGPQRHGGSTHQPSPLNVCQCLAGTGLLNGRSEELLGQFVREFPGSDKQRNSICIATKLAPYPWRITSGALQLHGHFFAELPNQ